MNVMPVWGGKEETEGETHQYNPAKVFIQCFKGLKAKATLLTSRSFRKGGGEKKKVYHLQGERQKVYTISMQKGEKKGNWVM